MADIEFLVTKEARKSVPDVQADEIQGFLKGLRAGLTIVAVTTATLEERSCSELESSNSPFNFEKYSRVRMANHLEACSGLPLDVCGRMICVIEDLVICKLQRSATFEIKDIGVFERAGSGYRLILDTALACVRA